MNSNRYFQEISRRLMQFNISAEGIKENGAFYFSFDGAPLCHVAPDGANYHYSEHLDTEEKKGLCSLVTEISEETRIYVQAVENASPLKAADLRDGYKLLSEHENIVLAGTDLGEHGYQFVTWRYTYDREGVTLGHYYHNDYSGAKEDFAVRYGLINEHKLFDNEELKEVYRALDQSQKYIPYLTFDQEQKILELKKKIEHVSPKAVEAYKTEHETQMEKPIFHIQIVVGDLEEDLLRVKKDTDGAVLMHELKLPATASKLQEAYNFQTKNETFYQIVKCIRYPDLVGDMSVIDLDCLNEAAKIIDQMDELQISELQLSMRGNPPEDEVQLKELCDNIHGPLRFIQNHLNM
ncbi:MAG TPA: hypothetical protein PKA19_01975 [Bacillota bacterium]|nr:hypothetical protein [Bacillota bacterium]